MDYIEFVSFGIGHKTTFLPELPTEEELSTNDGRN
jgi:hypothetical protein